jgi:hypothetical protein
MKIALLQIFVILLLLPIQYSYAIQDNVIILVDVSGSVNTTAATDAKELIKSIVNGQFNAANYPNWQSWSVTRTPNFSELYDMSQSKQTTPLIGVGQQVALMKIGIKDRCYEPFNSTSISDISYFNDFLDKKFPADFNDEWTYIDLTRAKTAASAHARGIDSYYLFVASDEVNDAKGINIPNNEKYNTNEKTLIDEYGLDGNINVSKLATINYRDDNYSITIFHVEITKFSPSAPTNCGLEFINTFAKADTVGLGNNNSPTIEWKCSNCNTNTKYALYLSKKDKVAFGKAIIQEVTAQKSYQYNNLSTGVYRLTIKTNGCLGQDECFFSIGKENRNPTIDLFLSNNEKKPTLKDAAPINILWSCDDCPSNRQYSISLQKKEGKGYKSVKNATSDKPTYRFDNLSGFYKVQIKLLGSTASDIGYLETASSGDSGILLLLLILAVAIYLFKKYRDRQDKNNKDENNHTSNHSFNPNHNPNPPPSNDTDSSTFDF